jgi:ABC-type lipoprotein export system ATPase subunit
MSDMIRLEHVVKVIGGDRRAISDVSLSVQKKERVAVQGGPGSGKTMLMRLIAGMEHPSDGSIYVSEQAVHKMGTGTAAAFRSKTFGILQRKPAFMENLSVLENVTMPLIIADISAADRKKTAREQLETMGLQYAASAHPSQLSVLETHKLAIARAVITKPPIFLIDELAAGLSEKDTKQIEDILHALLQSGEYTVLEFAGAGNALSQPDRVLNLAHGRLEETQ